MIFTNTDKTLMMRAGRLLVEQAKVLKTLHGNNWAATPESRKTKLEHDRLLRDDRDLRELAKRLEKAVTVLSHIHVERRTGLSPVGTWVGEERRIALKPDTSNAKLSALITGPGGISN